MLVGRTAMLILVGCLFLSPAPHGAVAVDSPATGAIALASQQLGLSIRRFPAQPAQATRFVQFVRWRARPKIVLGETVKDVIEEVDLGPALMPGRHIYFAANVARHADFRPLPVCAVDRPSMMRVSFPRARVSTLRIRVPPDRAQNSSE